MGWVYKNGHKLAHNASSRRRNWEITGCSATLLNVSWVQPGAKIAIDKSYCRINSAAFKIHFFKKASSKRSAQQYFISVELSPTKHIPSKNINSNKYIKLSCTCQGYGALEFSFVPAVVEEYSIATVKKAPKKTLMLQP